MGLALLAAYWAVAAQEGGPLWTHSAAQPTEPDTPQAKIGKQPSAAKPSRPTTSPRDKKQADPTLIVPAEAYDLPRPVGSELKPDTSHVMQVKGVLPPPMFPADPDTAKANESNTPPPLPAIDTKALPVPPPSTDPTKTLIVEPTTKDVPPKKSPTPKVYWPPPVLTSDTHKEPPAKAVLVPAATPLPIGVPGAKSAPIAPPPVIMPPPIVSPEATQAPLAPLPATQAKKQKAFVRLESASTAAPPPLTQPDSIPPDPIRAPDRAPQPMTPPPVIAPQDDAMAVLRMPSLIVEKRGSTSLRRGQPQPYHIVIRNLGSAPAQHIRIEDELPQGVRIHLAKPAPQLQGNKLVWLLPVLPAKAEQVLSLLLETSADTQMIGRTNVFVAATSQNATPEPRPHSDAPPLAITFSGPNQVALGKPAVFDIRVTNQSAEPLTGIILRGTLPEGLNTPQGREIEGEVEATIAPGESKTLKMPASAVKPGRYTVAVKVTTPSGYEVSATTPIEIAAAALHLQQAPAARLFAGRDGDLRVELTNHTGQPLRNVAVADRLPDGLTFVAANERGLYQANSRTVYWLIDQMPAGKTQTLVVRVNGVKAGEHQNVVFAKADGVAETQSAGVVALEGISDLTLRVVDRDNPLELGKETVYEIQVRNPGNVSATNVQLRVQFPPGLMPKNAEGATKFSMDRRTVLFEPIVSLASQGEAIYRVSAVAQSIGDQRVRFAVASQQVRLPIQREISTKVYSDKVP
jgi:uncharacterized repeat protein (TIGR01451 family)